MFEGGNPDEAAGRRLGLSVVCVRWANRDGNTTILHKRYQLENTLTYRWRRKVAVIVRKN